jgi:flagellar biosynthesis/type III secretory pathway ATPase
MLMRRAGHVARMGEMTNIYGILVGKPEGQRPFGDLGVNGIIILERIIRK